MAGKALARAMVRDTPILLLDEPTVGLDGENRELVTKAILGLARGRTTLLITHDLELAGRADVVARIEDGRLIATAKA